MEPVALAVPTAAPDVTISHNATLLAFPRLRIGFQRANGRGPFACTVVFCVQCENDAIEVTLFFVISRHFNRWRVVI